MAKRGAQISKPIAGIDLDTAKELLAQSKATFLKNCISDYNKAANDGASNNIGLVTPIVSNSTSFDTEMGSFCMAVGSKYDRKLNQMFWLVYVQNGADYILMYDGNTNTFTTVITSIYFNFDPHYLVTSIDIVIVNTFDDTGAATTNTLLYWNDGSVEGGNPPRKINIQTAIAGGYSAITFTAQPYQFFDAVKYPPYVRPSFGSALTNPDTSFVQNFILQKQFQFRYRFYYDDGEITKWSPISTFYFSKNNLLNFVELVMQAGSSLVIKIELAFRESNTADWKSYDTIDRSVIVANVIYPYDNTTNYWTYKFFNDRQYIILDQVDTNLKFDVLPIKATSQEFIQPNLIVYGGILEGYNNLPVADQAIPTIDITYADYAPLTLTVALSLYHTDFAGDIPEAELHRIDFETGEDIIENTTVLNVSPKNYSVVLTDVDINDVIYLLVSGNVASTINNNSTMIGTYSNITVPLAGGTGDFSVLKNGGAQNLALAGVQIVFNSVVSDPLLTWNTATYNYDTVPNYALAFSQLRQGGKYQFGFICYDEANRSSFVQTSTALEVVIEPIQQNSKFQIQSSIIFNWNNIELPSWVKNVAVCRTKELTVDRSLGRGYIQWGIEDVAFYKADNTVGTPAVDAIKTIEFTLQGLIDFNTDNLFVTTTDYTYSKKDRIVFIANGDGTFYDTTNNGTLDFPLSSDDSITFRFPYNAHLDTLIDGAWVMIYTPAKQAQNLEFFEISDLIPTVTTNGITKVTQVVTPLKTWDTYPVQYDAKYFSMTGIATQPIEHHSIYTIGVVPSSGEDIGRDNVVNPTARQLWKPALTRFSYPYLPTTFINGLSSFDEPRAKQYNDQKGQIVQMHSDGTNIIFIQTDYTFRAVINKALVTYADGNTALITNNDILSNAIELEGIDAGCQNSESFADGNGLMYWLDAKRSIVVECDWNSLKDIAREGMIKSYIEAKTKYCYRQNFASGAEFNFWRTPAIIDPKTKQYILTFFNVVLPEETFGLQGDYCEDVTPILLIHELVGGVFTGTGVVPFGDDYYFDPSVAGVGTFTITETSGGNSVSTTVTVNPLPTVTLEPFDDVLVTDPPFILTGGLPLGGYYQVNGDVLVYLDPSIYGAGTLTVYYIYTDTNTCSQFATQPLQINP